MVRDVDGEDDALVVEPEAPARSAAIAPSASPSSSARIAAVKPPASSAPLASASASSAADAGPPPSPLCARILAKNAAFAVVGADALEEKAHAGCHPTPNGAWVIRIDAWKKVGEWAGADELAGAWTLVHIDRAGHEVEGKPGPAEMYGLHAGGDSAEIGAIQLFDYDGDGEPEILITTYQRGFEDAAYQRAVVATFAGGVIAELGGLPKAYEGFEDVDHDGRPDVVWHPYAYDHEGGLGGVHEEGAEFVAHALPGGAFSLDDDVARGHVDAACPRSRVDAGWTAALPEVCALLRGATRVQALAVLEKQCIRPDFDAGDTPSSFRPGVCTDFAERESALDTPPPLHLAP